MEPQLKHQVEARQQVASMGEQSVLHHVLTQRGANGVRPSCSFSGSSSPSQAIARLEMMQIKPPKRAGRQTQARSCAGGRCVPHGE
jgi:hypothetical protein